MINKHTTLWAVFLASVTLVTCAKKEKVMPLSAQYNICIRPTVKFSYELKRGIDSINLSIDTKNGSFNAYIGNNPDTRNHFGSLPKELSPSIKKIYSEYHADVHEFNSLYAYEEQGGSSYDDFPIYILFSAHNVTTNSLIIRDISAIGNSLVVCPDNINPY